MALEKVFFDPRALKRFGEGPLAPELDGFCEWLSNVGLGDPPFVVTFQGYPISVAI